MFIIHEKIKGIEQYLWLLQTVEFSWKMNIIREKIIGIKQYLGHLQTIEISWKMNTR